MTVAEEAGRGTTRSRRGVVVFALGLLVMVAMIGGSLGMYLPTRATIDKTTYWGDVDNPDRVDISVWITKVDPASATLTVTVDVTGPSGSLSDDQGFFLDDATLYTLTSLQNMTTQMDKDDYPPVVEQRFALSGMETDYPFDHYSALLEYHVIGGPDGDELPLVLTLYSTDPFFAVDSSQVATQDGGVAVDLKLRRSTPTLVYASFAMVLMLGLAIASITASYYLIKWKKGLLFPACGMLATILFALIPLRNAMPGSPPIGSVIDFASFFIAVITISIGLIAVVIIGYRSQLRNDRKDAHARQLSIAAYARIAESSVATPPSETGDATTEAVDAPRDG
ncbi:MAG: DUF4436 family protein [Mycolicibacterium sp.]